MHSRVISLKVLIFSIVFLSLATGARASAQEVILHRFGKGSDGADPYANLIADSAHNLYGTTFGGGNNTACSYGGPTSCGTVFKMMPPAGKGGAWTEKVLYNFQGGTDGAFPLGGLIFDAFGKMYGVTTEGGETGAGTAYQLTPQADGTWRETVLYHFKNETDGFYPRGPLAFDAVGNLFGTCNDGGAGYGTVFELSPQSSGEWIETTLHTFNPYKRDVDGADPVDGVLLDQTGNVYGITAAGGSDKVGVMFKLTPPRMQGNPWYEQILYTFGNEGSYPDGLLFFRGAFWGTTEIGGEFGQGTVFQITFSGSIPTLTTLYSFAGGDDGAGPYAGVIIDSALNIYGTTVGGGGLGGCTNFLNGCGTVFKLSPPQVQGGLWTETILHSFAAGVDGSSPAAVLLMQGGWLLGTTTAGGIEPCTPVFGCGTVFAVKK